jgi:hypothetical protein
MGAVGLRTGDVDEGDDCERESSEPDASKGDLPPAHPGSFPDLGTFVTGTLWRTVGSADAPEEVTTA